MARDTSPTDYEKLLASAGRKVLENYDALRAEATELSRQAKELECVA